MDEIKGELNVRIRTCRRVYGYFQKKVFVANQWDGHKWKLYQDREVEEWLDYRLVKCRSKTFVIWNIVMPLTNGIGLCLGEVESLRFMEIVTNLDD